MSAVSPFYFVCGLICLFFEASALSFKVSFLAGGLYVQFFVLCCVTTKGKVLRIPFGGNEQLPEDFMQKTVTLLVSHAPQKYRLHKISRLNHLLYSLGYSTSMHPCPLRDLQQAQLTISYPILCRLYCNFSPVIYILCNSKIF